MIYLQFLIGFLMYSLMAYASYSQAVKSSPWFFPLGIAAAIVSNIMWLWIAKLELNTSTLVVKGLWWDAMLTSIYIIVPLVFFAAKLSSTQSIGLALVIIGLFLTKI